MKGLIELEQLNGVVSIPSGMVLTSGGCAPRWKTLEEMAQEMRGKLEVRCEYCRSLRVGLTVKCEQCGAPL